MASKVNGALAEKDGKALKTLHTNAHRAARRMPFILAADDRVSTRPYRLLRPFMLNRTRALGFSLDTMSERRISDRSSGASRQSR